MIVRSPRPTTSFTVLENRVLRDSRLTLKARGLLALLLSYPDNWRASSERLARLGPDGRDAIRTALRELEDAGYVIRKKTQNPKTGRWTSETHVYDYPQTAGDNPATYPLPTPENPTPETPSL